MKNEFFKQFRIPDAECEIETMLDSHGVPQLFFRSPGNLVSLDLTGASQLRQFLAHAGQIDEANEINKHIEIAKRLDAG